ALLRATVASASNDHRLGANEAPPAIMSAYLGEQLADVFEQIKKGDVKSSKSKGVMNIGVDTLPALGAALRTLDAGDSTGAARAIEQIAGGLPPDGGRADLRLFAGRLYAGARQPADAERVLQQAVVKDVPSTAAAALLELGRLYLAAARGPEAVAALEQMILEYPGSALLPQGRRLLDQARNAVPRT
ncbi:MAG TPA: hypothetical protein PKA50_04605, partial [Gemmatimonadales bacterium]|nr:hypothetical protein [Gemmatimonadales bacterium]